MENNILNQMLKQQGIDEFGELKKMIENARNNPNAKTIKPVKIVKRK